MRINLKCPYDEKEQAKALGARWDGKTWYIVDVEDLTPFMRWIVTTEKRQTNQKKAHQEQRRKNHKSAVVTKSAHVPHCGCHHVLPWEDCEHTESAAQSAMREMLSLQDSAKLSVQQT